MSDATVALCLLAALADGEHAPAERDQLERLAGGAPLDPGESLESLAARLGTPEERRRAYEMAVSIVYADGAANPAERSFLDRLRKALGEPDDALNPLHQEAESVALATVTGPLGGSSGGGRSNGEPSRPSQAGIPAMSHDAALDELIRRQALLCGALELLPQNLATLAIIPLQTRMVYRIGADFGQKAGPEQIKDLVGAMGVGAAAQVLDGMARRVVGGLGRGLLGRVLGGIVGGAAGAAASAGVSFVATYAIGHAAKQYYAQGRNLSREDLQALFQRFRQEGEALLPKVQEEIHTQAQRLDLGKVVSAIRGSAPAP